MGEKKTAVVSPGQIEQWLKERGVYDAFAARFIRREQAETIETYLEWMRPTEAISSAFFWGETPEGHKYWNEIDRDYRKWVADKTKHAGGQ